MYDIQQCFIRRPSDSTASEDAGIDPRTVVTSPLAIADSLTTRLSEYLVGSTKVDGSHPACGSGTLPENSCVAENSGQKA